MSKNDFHKAASLYQGKALAYGNENQYEKVEWVCKRKHRFTASLFNVNKGIWCLKCKKEDEKEEVVNGIHELAAFYGGECLTKGRFAMASSIKLKCCLGHVWNSHPNSVFEGSWCKICEKTFYNKERFEKIKEIVLEKGGELLSDIPYDNATKIFINCSKGHKFKIVLHNLLSGKWCKYCSYKSFSDQRKFPLSVYQEIAEKKGGKVLTTLKQYDTVWPNLEFQCANKHTWITHITNIRSGNWCPRWECHYDPSKYIHDRIGYDEYSKAAKKHGGKLLTPKKDFVNSLSILKWECKNGHVFKQQAGGVRTSGKWCSKCIVWDKNNSVLESYKKWALSNGFKILTKSVNENISSTHLEWQCSKGHTWKATGAHMKVKNSCTECTSAEIRKYYLQEIQKAAISKGGECVSTEYLNNYTHLEFRCKNGHTFFANANNVKTGWWCAHCSGNAKLNIDVFKEIAIRHGGQLISKEYIDVDHSLNWKCKQGHTFHLTGHSVKNQHKWCPHCNGGKKLALVKVGEQYVYNIDDMQKLAATKGGICLSKKYLGSNTNLKWQCREGHQWEARPGKIKLGSWCKICSYEENAKARRLPLSDIIQIVADRDGKLLSTEKSYHLNFPLVKLKCNQGHIWETDIKYIKYGSWCPDCKYDAISLKTRFPLSHYQKLVSRKEGKLLTTEKDYQNSRSKLTIKCKKGHVFEKIAGVLNLGGWCEECG